MNILSNESFGILGFLWWHTLQPESTPLIYRNRGTGPYRRSTGGNPIRIFVIVAPLRNCYLLMSASGTVFLKKAVPPREN